jgi:hypothetical protein
MAGNQVTDDDSGVEPQTGPASDEPQAASPDAAAAKDEADEGVTADASTKATDGPKKPEAKADNKSKLKGKDEPQPARAQKAADAPAPDVKVPDDKPAAQAASEPQPSKPKGLAEIMKVDMRARRRRRY